MWGGRAPLRCRSRRSRPYANGYRIGHDECFSRFSAFSTGPVARRTRSLVHKVGKTCGNKQNRLLWYPLLLFQFPWSL